MKQYFFCLPSLILLLNSSVIAQEKPDESPRVLMCVPLGALHGETAKFTLRGLKLEGATEVKTADQRVPAKLVSQGKANVPNNQNPQKVGDNQVEFELVLPADLAAGKLELTVVTAKGEAKYSLPVGGEHPVILEKEPNPGFKQSQPIQLPQIVIGGIENAHDVDVFSFDASAGQKLSCEVFADRLGSGCDGLMTAYDAAGRILATSDDTADSRDPKLGFTAPSAGKIFVVLQDANDQGGPAHPYRLVIKEAN